MVLPVEFLEWVQLKPQVETLLPVTFIWGKHLAGSRKKNGQGTVLIIP